MPRNPENVRVEILFTPEQYTALVNWVEAEGYTTDAKKSNGEIGEAIRELLSWASPAFAAAKPLQKRGQHER